jgi:hypothetical protein
MRRHGIFRCFFPRTSEVLAAGIMFSRSDGFARGLDDDNPGIKTCCMETASSPILCTESTFARGLVAPSEKISPGLLAKGQKQGLRVERRQL